MEERERQWVYKYRETTKDTNNEDFCSLRRFRFGTSTISGHFRSLAGRTDRSTNSRKKIYHWWKPCGNRDICIRSRRKKKTKDIRNTRAKRQFSQTLMNLLRQARTFPNCLSGWSSVSNSFVVTFCSECWSFAYDLSARTAELTRVSIVKFYNNYSCANINPHAIIP
jgi:hypothetical protein